MYLNNGYGRETCMGLETFEVTYPYKISLDKGVDSL